MQHWCDTVFAHRIGSTIMGPNWVMYMIQLLRSVGMPEKMLPYMLAQIAHETDGGRSALANTYHNWSGIKANNHGHSSGSTANGFAMYKTDKNWASDYKRVLSMPPGRPIAAAGAEDFYQRLNKNGYFTKAEGPAYAKAFNVRLKEVSTILNDKSGDLATVYRTKTIDPDTNKIVTKDPDADSKGKGKGKGGDKDGLAFFKKHPILTGVGLAIGTVVVIKLINN